MTNPCELGMKCPFWGVDGEGDGGCFYPYMVGRDTVADDETFPLDYEADCPLVDYDTEFHYLIDAYGDAHSLVLQGVRDYKLKCDELYQKMVTRVKEREDGKAIYNMAYEKDPKAVDELTEIYHSTDMPDTEYISHLKLIAKGD